MKVIALIKDYAKVNKIVIHLKLKLAAASPPSPLSSRRKL